MKNKKLIVGIAGFIILAGFAGWYFYRDWANNHRQNEPVGQNTANPGENPQAENKSDSGLTKEELLKRMPNLDKEVVIQEEMSNESKLRLITEIKSAVAVLKEDYDRLEGWLNLGIYRKQAGDYEGAKEAWEFATLIRPKNPIAFHNLGDLYWMYLKNYPLAETYFKKAIEIDPKIPLFYSKLHELYRYSYKEKADLADDILRQGIKATDDPVLKEMLDNFLKGQ